MGLGMGFGGQGFLTLGPLPQKQIYQHLISLFSDPSNNRKLKTENAPMHISGFHIDGFGIYRDQGVKDLPPGLVLFVGDNESGKTTLMEFVRTLLFGFKRGQNDYQPVHGGGHGGRLVLLMQDGHRVTVERRGRQVTIAQDGAAPQRGEPGEQLLGGIDRPTFEHIFAIGLKELQGLGVLSREGVRGRLFAASAGLGAASVPAALKSLDDELGRLYAPRSKKLLAQLLDRLRENAKALKLLQGQAAAYAACRRQKEELEARVHIERAELEELRRRRHRLQQLEQARQPWAVRLAARQRAAELKAVKDFPPFGLEQLEHLQGDVEKIRLSLTERQGEAARLQERLAETSPDEALLAQREDIEALFGEREKIATLLAELPALRHSLNRAEEAFQGRLRDLGPDWDAARLHQVDTSVAVRQQVQDFRRQFDLLERRHEQLKVQAAFLEGEAEEARRRLEEARRNLVHLATPPLSDVGELREKQEALNRLRTLWHRREVWETRLEDRRLRRAEADARLAVLRERLEIAYDPLPWWGVPPVAFTGFIVAVLLSLHVNHLAGNLSLLAGLGAAGLLYLWRRRLLRHEGERRAGLEAEAASAADQTQTLGADIAALASQTASLQDEMLRASLEVADGVLPDLADLERLAADLDKVAQHLKNWQVLEHEQTKTAERLAESLTRLDKARQKTEETAQELAGVKTEWRAWLAAHGFPEALSPAAFETVLQAVERAREAGGAVDDSRLRLQEAVSYLKEASRRIHALLAACGRSPGGTEAGLADLDALRRALSEALETERAKGELENRLAASQEQTAQLNGLLQDKGGEFQRLLAQAGAADEDEFRRSAALHQEYRDCLKRLEQSGIALLNIAGNPEAQRDLEGELERSDALTTAGEKDDLEARVLVLTESLPQTDQEMGRLKLQLDQMAQDEKLGDLLQEQSILEEQLEEAMRRWAVLAISRRLVETAREVYERERQPQVLQEAGRFLEIMAGGRYRLVSPPGELSLQLEDAARQRKAEIHWSHGLADQVYLAVRLGLAREFSRQALPLPVILDDVLVKFDPRRRRGAARVILEVAREQQVFLFTCHPEFQNMIASLHREDYLQETLVSYFHIADGLIHPDGPG
jgi:uncharacterized protein YhaN